MSTGKDIKRLRERLGMSQASFCAELSISQAQLSKIEAGEAPVKDSLLLRISIRFNEPDLVVSRCRICPVREAAAKIFPELAGSSQQLMVRQLREDVSRVLDAMATLGEALPPKTSPDHALALLQLDELAQRARNYLDSFRILIYRD